ncbi:MAG TPA: hypothetical protein VNX21_03535, partial [Candidatus Thermoplasmatota archaeon]|nr:hypothetical protein [Candidatus Thermoplasmatota archaeon]
CQHRLPTHGVRESDCGSVSLSPTARAALRPTSDGWYYVDAKVCAHYTGWMCAWHGALPLPDPRGWPGLVQPYARANPDGTYTVGEDCRILMPWPLSGQSCSASYTVKPDFVLVTPRRTWDGVTTDTYACRAYAAPTLGYACTYAGEGPNAHAWVYGDDDGSADPDVRVCTAGWSWCPVNKRVDLPPVLP